MKLRRLTIDRLPGIDQPFEIECSGAGVHVVFGPNAIGKSSLCRAVESLYWEDRGPTERISVTAQFELHGHTWWAEREGARLRWRCDDDRPRPAMPSAHHHRCFFLRLRDLIDPALDGTHDIASEIRRQMSGGFDLHRIAETYFSGITKRHGRRQRDDYNAAASAVQQAEGNQSALQRREDQLAHLRTQHAAAVTAARRLPSVDRALGLARRIQAHASIEEEIATLPGAVARLTGQELEQIDRHQSRIRQLESRIRDFENERDAARQAVRDSRLAAEVTPSELAVLRAQADELTRTEMDLGNARTHRAECRREVASALSALGGGPVDEVSFTLEDGGHLFEFLRAASEHRTQRSAVEWRLRILARIEQSESRDRHLVELRAATDRLRQWLRAPAVEVLRDRLRARRIWILVAVAIAVVGAGLAVFVDPRFGFLATVGAGIAVPVLLLRSTNPAPTARVQAEEAFARLDVDAPDAWSTGSVEVRLRTLEAEVVSIESRLQRARDRDVERQGLGAQLGQLDEAEAALDERRRHLLDSLGLDSLLPDAELVDCARGLDQVRTARIKDAGAAGRVDELEAAHAGLLSDQADALQAHGEPRPTDAKTAEAYRASLADRNTRFLDALDDARQAGTQLEQLSTDRQADLDSISKLYATAALEDGDRQGLTALLELLPLYRDLREQATRLEGQIGLDREELAKADEIELVDLGETRLERLAEDLASAADGADAWQREISDIGAEVSQAKRTTSLQDLIAHRENTRAALENRRDEAMFAGAGTFLIDAVEREHEQTQMPRVFERALGHFSAFTHHGYELRLGRDSDSPRLLAFDSRSGKTRELDELSDGTRAQLLLAARIAYAEEVEQGRTLPLFLDEALDQSDPDRFEAIARSLGQIASDQDRQVFYLTSDPLDRERIRHALEAENCAAAAEIDLGLLRGRAASVTEASALRVPTRPAVPSPDGTTAQDYAIALGVPRFMPARGYFEQHLLYVLFDDLELLHALLTNGIERAGQWKTVSGTALAKKLAARSTTSRQMDSRLRLLETFCELWEHGRGRIVDRDVLVQSGAVSDQYLDRVADIVDDLNGNAEELLSALRKRNDPRLRGFRQRRAEALEAYLRDNGYLDERPVLGQSDLILRTLSSPPASELPDGLAHDTLGRWWTWATTMSGSPDLAQGSFDSHRPS